MFVLLACAIGFRGGWPTCTTNGPTVPSGWVRSRAAANASIACDGAGECVLSADRAIRGYVVSSLEPVLNGGRSCLTHSSNADKSSVAFRVGGRTTVWATVVYSKASTKGHLYTTVGGVPVNYDPNGVIYVVGAGPGGIAAARRAHELGRSVVVYERGDYPPAGFYDGPMAATYYNQFLVANPNAAFLPMGVADSSYTLVSVVGGLQNINGGVYAPGTAADLADSLGDVLLADAALAQDRVAAWTPHRPATVVGSPAHAHHGVMHACMPNTTCDERYLAYVSTQTQRRSIAWDFALPVHTGVHVAAISDTAITFQNGSAQPLAAGDSVVLAAGALSSPQLLGRVTFCGYNHYFTYTHTTPAALPGPTQVLDYTTPGYESNIALSDNKTAVNITMQMQPATQECHTVGVPYPTSGNQAWHFMGTVPHTRMRVAGRSRVYVGDASALMRPFNCHTSAPASAAGVLAVEAATGRLGVLLAPKQPNDRSSVDVELFEYYGVLFGLAGITVAVGVMGHALATVTDEEEADLKKLRFASWPAVVWWVVSGINTTRHFGHVASGTLHRVTGYAIVYALAYMFYTVTVRLRDLRTFERHAPTIVLAWAALLLLLATLPVAALWRYCLYAAKPPPISVSKNVHYYLMPLSLAMIIAAVAMAAQRTRHDDGSSYMKRADASHFYVGWAVFIVVLLQVPLGGLLKLRKPPAHPHTLNSSLL